MHSICMGKTTCQHIWTGHVMTVVKRSQVQGVIVKMRWEPVNAVQDTRPPNGGPRLIRSFPYSWVSWEWLLWLHGRLVKPPSAALTEYQQTKSNAWKTAYGRPWTASPVQTVTLLQVWLSAHNSSANEQRSVIDLFKSGKPEGRRRLCRTQQTSITSVPALIQLRQHRKLCVRVCVCLC